MKKTIWQKAVRTSGWIGLLFVTVWVVAGCTSTGEDGKKFSPLPPGLDAPATNGVAGTNSSTFSAAVQTGDRFAIGDQVTVKFSGTVDTALLPHEERIKEDGTITLPLIGAVKAEGKTTGELQKEIHDRYVPDYYKRLTVIVTGEQRVYSVGGQVKAPGRQVYISATTVTKAIQSAGDFTDFAAKRKVKLTRQDGKTLTVDCIKASREPSLDPPVYPGDKIDVPQRGPFDFN